MDSAAGGKAGTDVTAQGAGAQAGLSPAQGPPGRPVPGVQALDSSSPPPRPRAHGAAAEGARLLPFRRLPSVTGLTHCAQKNKSERAVRERHVSRRVPPTSARFGAQGARRKTPSLAAAPVPPLPPGRPPPSPGLPRTGPGDQGRCDGPERHSPCWVPRPPPARVPAMTLRPDPCGEEPAASTGAMAGPEAGPGRRGAGAEVAVTDGGGRRRVRN